MNPREIALALAVTTVVVDAATERKEQLRAELFEALENVGADAVKAELPSGERIAKSSITSPAPKAAVVDEAALIAYVQQTYPHNIETKISIRPAFLNGLLKGAIEVSDYAAVDPETGEIIPGVAFSHGRPFISTRFDKGGRDAVIDAIRAGDLSLDVASPAPALEGGQL